jgi:uncharacterized protein YpuA (DUF1002 family)
MDKIWAARPPNSVHQEKSNHFPYQFGQEELEKRLHEFAQLQVKVTEQRKQIKKRDLIVENSLKQRIKEQNEVNDLIRQERRLSMVKVRELASTKIRRFKSTRSQDYSVNFEDTRFNKTGYFTRKDSLCKDEFN